MNITDVEITGFGIWKNLRVENLAPGLTVFYGPNEAGKSTIMQFMRAMLYGFTPGRRAKYLPPVFGGKAGGRLTLHRDRETWNVHRVEDVGLGALTLHGPDDHEYGEAQLKSLLSDVDESTYNNVFSLSLHELQELSTLQETDAGRLLYEMSAGLDRVSLGDVLRELNTSRGRLMSAGDKPSQITDLMSQRDRLRGELDALAAGWRGRRRLSEEKSELERAVTAAQQEQTVLNNELRTAEAAWSLKDMWRARAELNDQLNSIGPTDNVPSDAVERMDHANSVLRRCKIRRKKLIKKRDGIRKQYAAIQLNANLWKQAPRILALTEHEPWLAALDQQNRDAKTQAGVLEKKLVALRTQLGVHGDLAAIAHESMGRKLAGVLSIAKQLRQAVIRLKDAKAGMHSNRGVRDDSQIEIDELLAARGESSLTAAMDKTGQIVSLYRRRAHLDERLEQMARNKADLEFDLREYADLQMIPTWALVGLGATFVFGAFLILAGLILTNEFVGGRKWPMVVLGVIMAGVSTMIKSQLEHTASRKADGCQKQLTLLHRQIEQAEAERVELDEQMPEGTGTLAARLESAENELMRLEDLVPLESRRVSSHQESLTVRERLKAARIGYEKARKRWISTLTAAKLPETWTPAQVRDLAKQYADLGQLHKQFESSQTDQDRRLREAASLKTRVEALFADTMLVPESASLLEQIRQLRRELTTHETKTTEQAELKSELLKHRRKLKSYDRTLRKYEKQRESLLRGVNAPDETQFRSRVQKYLQLSDLTKRRDNFAREIHSAIQGFCTEEDLSRWFRGSSKENIETRLPELRTRSGAVAERLRQLFEKRGALQQQAKLAIEDRRFVGKQLELNVVEQKIADAAARWRTFTVTHALLDNLKLEYERNRQPETLREAGEYLNRLTNGQYRRVWTPLGESRLCVDDEHGRPIGVEQLSRGTREQLFLSLRLALASFYARRGKIMPLVLDDVLVNFDNIRAEAAATVLRDFADAGHQMLLFTCHEHIGRIFKLLNVDVRRLPTHEHPEKWLIFEIPEIQTRYIEVPRPIEVVRETIAETVPEPEYYVEPAPEPEPIKVVEQPRKKRRRERETVQVRETVEDIPTVVVPNILVERTPQRTDYSDRVPQPKPQPIYVEEPRYREPREVTPPKVLRVYEQPLQPAQRQPTVVYEYQSQPRPAPVRFEPVQPKNPPKAQLPAEPQRLDPPQQIVGSWIPQRVRWNAEEFEGELDDQVRRRQERLARQAAAAKQAAMAGQPANGASSNGSTSVVETRYAPPMSGQFIAGVSEVRQMVRYGNGTYEQSTEPQRAMVRETQDVNGAIRRRRNRAVGESISPEELADQPNATGWIQVEDPNVERVERIRYYEREIDGE